nr:MAG TPA: SECRETED 45 KDA PROTEIN CYCLE, PEPTIDOGLYCAN, CHAP, CELL [Caudoviricetes sp.]
MKDGINPVYISLLISLVGIVATIWSVNSTIHKGNKDQAKELAEELGKMNANITYVKEGITDLKATTRDVSNRVMSLENRLAQTETSVTFLSDRIRQIEERRGRELK